MDASLHSRMHALFTLAAAQQPDMITVILAVISAAGVVVVIFGALHYREERNKRLDAESRLGQAFSSRRQHDEESAQRENTMFSQHKQMNDLQIAKLTAEVELLQNQVKAKAIDEDRIEASKEYHELMVEKTRLEMDTLRLHLMELRKRARTEDWRSEE